MQNFAFAVVNMAAVVLQGSLLLSKQQAGVAVAAVSCIQRKPYSSNVHVIKRPALAQLRKGTGGRSSFNGIVATVFGSTGPLGRNLVNRLGCAGSQVILPYRGDSHDMRPMKLMGDLGQILFQPFHLKDEASIRQAVKYSNVVVNCIGKPFETKNFTFDEVHVEGARRIARIAREAGVEKLIHVSALNCTPNPMPFILKNGSGFLRSKYYGELAVREEFPDAVIFRPAHMFGRNDRFMLQLIYSTRKVGRKVPVWNKGYGTTKMPIFINDVSAAIWEAIKSPDSVGQTYSAVGPHRYILHDLYDWYLKEMCYDIADFKIMDARDSPFWLLKTLMYPFLPGDRPTDYLSLESVEQELTTDRSDNDSLKVGELGIQPVCLEDHIRHLTEPYRYYTPDHTSAVPKIVPPEIVGFQ